MSQTSVPKRRKSARRNEILAAARSVFLEKPFNEASVSEIAARAGCVEGTLYTYFKNKRDLFDAILTEFYDRLIADISPQLPAITNTRDRLCYLVARHLQISVDDPAVARLIARESRGQSVYFGSPLHALNRRYTQLMLNVIKEGVQRGELREDLDPTLARDLIFGGLEHRIWNLLGHGRRYEPAREAQDIVDLVLVGWRNKKSDESMRHLAQRLTRIEGQLRKRGLAS